MAKQHVTCYLRDILKSRHTTQADFAQVCKVDPADLSRIASGRRIPRLPAARRIARALGVNIDAVWPDTVPKRHK